MKFFLRFLLLASLMFIAVLFGMQQANEGINKMKGYESEQFLGAVHIGEDEAGNREVSLLGEEMDSHDLEKKKEKLEEIKAFNLFSEIGKKLADAVTSIMGKLIDLIGGAFS